MTTIESTKSTVNGKEEEVRAFLSDLNNFQRLLPPDKISEWESSADACSFKIQHAATIDFVKAPEQQAGQLNLTSGDKSPFAFQLTIHLSDQGEACEVFSVFEADLNPMLKMMVKKPLQNLFDFIIARLEKQFK